jgi:acetoin utilization protein AcuB
MKVSDYMSSSVVTANLDDGLRQTYIRMKEHGIRHMPVVDASERVVGIVSDRDLRRPDTVDVGDKVDAYSLDDSHAVKAVMTGCPDSVTAESSLDSALGLFVTHHYGALPVVNAGGNAVAMISVYDVLRAFQDAGTAG